ncbi:MAG: SsrA-binding protein SmpB [Gammaproteobacteria bacterium]|nr:SsrA-binding protein SmpB [Gammaproteobacteria bacterium]MDH5275283.1 SsrA-binding protein SmpB [Gammaproteobacteria bacterium]
MSSTKSSKAGKSSKPAKGHDTPKLIAENRKARFDFYIEDQLEAGIALLGWEVKSMRDARANLKESYAVFRDDELWLIGAHITPLTSASTHVEANPVRMRKLLLHRRELDRLRGAVERDGYTLVPLAMHWVKGRAKVTLGLARGKNTRDKRDSIKDRDWQRQKGRLMRRG